MSVNGPISLKQCYYEMDYSFYSFYWLDSLETRLDHNSTYYRSLSKNSDVKPRISHCDSQNLQYKTHPEFWPSHRRIFKTSLYYKTRLILETRRYLSFPPNHRYVCYIVIYLIFSHRSSLHWMYWSIITNSRIIWCNMNKHDQLILLFRLWSVTCMKWINSLGPGRSE